MNCDNQLVQMEKSSKPNPELAFSDDPNSKFSNHTECEYLPQGAKLMARQQLEVSTDSPFNLAEGMSFDHIEKAQSLREETEEIKRQLDLVRNQLTHFNEAKQNSSSGVDQPSNLSTGFASQTGNKLDERKHYEMNQQATSSDSQFHPRNRTSNPNGPSTNQPKSEQARIRPLTGKADCPNCECDKRRKSICDSCASFQQPVVRPIAESCIRRPSFISGEQHQSNEFLGDNQVQAKASNHINYDERPMRPAKPMILDSNKDSQTSNKPLHVQREVVPNQIFSIGKSLNDKRAQLAKAIDDLQLMMDRVKKRGERLDQERKVAQLYKEQWRFGPTIGGGSSLRNGQFQGRTKANYQSRLDPQLTRDSNSLMGFQHIEPSMRLREVSSRSSPNIRQPVNTPHPKPRYSKISKIPSVAQQSAISTRLARSKELLDYRHVRSKSLDSLQQVDRIVISARRANPSTRPRVINHKEHERPTSTEREVRPEAVPIDEARGPEEELEEEIDDGQATTATRDREDDADEVRENDMYVSSERQNGAGSDRSEQPAKKMSWVPVFGETEIKTVDRRLPTRKTLVLDGQPAGTGQRPPGSILRQQAPSNMSRASAMKQRSYSAVNSRNDYNGGVINEATKKLKFANNLLEREKRDSSSRNQIIVSNKLPPPTTHSTRHRSETQSSFKSISAKTCRSIKNKQILVGAAPQDLVSEANQEIERLHAKTDEQQRIISQLPPQSGSCCCGQHQSGRPLSSPRQTKSKSIASHRTPHSNDLYLTTRDAKHQLVAHLREQLNKTRARLAKMLEEERLKHEQLESRVHSSLRRQTDLRAENEILRQSLSRCINTCLRDISNTFESLNETIADSAFSKSLEESSQSFANDNGTGELTDVAQLIDKNRLLRQMRSHIESVEDQRRSLFEELSNEKLRSKQLELQLIESKLLRDQLIESNKKLERKLFDWQARDQNEVNPNRANPQPSTSARQIEVSATGSSTSDALDVSQQQSQADLSDKTTDGSEEHITPTTSATFDSIDNYRQYIQSMTPDLETIRRERRMILDEFDNIKKMLATMNE